MKDKQQTEEDKFFDQDLQPDEGDSLKTFSSKNFLTINRILLPKFTPNGAVFISNLIDQFLFHQEKGKLNSKGHFFHTHDQQIKETGLTEDMVKKWKNKFISLGILTTKRYGLPAKEWYKINIQKMKEVIKSEDKPYKYQETPDPLKKGGQEEGVSGGLYPPEEGGLYPPEEGGLNNNTKSITRLDNNNEEVSKDTIIGPSDQPMISSQSSSRRKLPSNNPQDKEQSPSKKEHIIPGDWKKLALDTWNRIPDVNHHTDMTTKTMERVSEYLERMTQGTFFNLCHVDQDFIKNNKIPQWWERDHKKFTPREILNAIRNFSLYYDEAYWPPNKNTLPKSLDTFIYNPSNRWSKNGKLHEKKASSFLLRCIANPNIEPMKVCKDFNPQYTQYFAKKQLLQYFKEDDLPNVYRGIQAIETRVIRDKVFDFANGSTNPDLKRAIGIGPGKLEPMFEKYANYLAHEYNRLEPERMFSRYGYFQDFLEYLKEEYSGFRVRI